MNNTQFYLSIGIPTLTVLLAWLSNRSDINRLNDKVDRLAESLRAEMTSLRIDINREMLALRNDMSRDMIAFRKEIHEDLMILH